MPVLRTSLALILALLAAGAAQAGPRYGYGGQTYGSHAEVMQAAEEERRGQLESVRPAQRPRGGSALMVVPDRPALKAYLTARSGKETIAAMIDSLGLSEDTYWSQMLAAQGMSYRFPADLLRRRQLFDELRVVEGGFGRPETPDENGLTIWQTPLDDGIAFRVLGPDGKQATYTFKPRHGSRSSTFERWREIWLMEFEAFLKVHFPT